MPSLPDRVNLPLTFDPARLEADLARLEAHEWIAHFVRENYEGEWSVIPLRGPVGETHPVRMAYSDPGCTEFVDTPFLPDGSYFSEVLAAFRSPLHAARLMRLGTGSMIKEHRDLDLCAEEGMVRLHVPIRTNPAVDFRLNGSPVVMRPGECWYLRLSDPHSVANRGDAPRVHLVIDAPFEGPLRDLIVRAAASSVCPEPGRA